MDVVVEDDVLEVGCCMLCDDRCGSEVHEEGTVAVEHPHVPVGC
jgi:hypothetical protein